MFQIEKIQNMEPAALRRWLKKEFTESERYGDSNTVMKAGISSEIMYGVLDTPKILAELTQLLMKYSDFQIEPEKPRLIVKGRMKGEPQKMASCIRLGLLHNADIDMMIAFVGDSSVFYCNQLEFIDNLAGVFGFQLALLIQDNKEMKAFYLEYLKWLRPYYQQIMELRSDMEVRLVHTIRKIVKQYPIEEPIIAPVVFNIAYLLHGIRQTLHRYNLPNVETVSAVSLLGFNVSREEFRFSGIIDVRTFNGLTILYVDKDRGEDSFGRRLSDRQTLILIKELMAKLERFPNPICQLLFKDLADIMMKVLLLEEDTEPSEIFEKIEQYLEIIYCEN